jgi:hypothetical protein
MSIERAGAETGLCYPQQAMRPTRALVLWLVVSAFACGGKAVGDGTDAGTGTSSGGDSGTSRTDSGSADDSGVVTVDASTSADATPVVTCTLGGGSGSGGGTSCEILQSETCNGTEYQVDCRCPERTCTCSGSSGGVVTFTGCPTCPTIDQAFTLCGTPH